MRTNAIVQAAAVAVVFGCGVQTALGQAPPPVILLIDTQNVVEYQDDVGDPAKFGQVPTPTPSSMPKAFPVITVIADIVAVNGQPAKGTVVGHLLGTLANPAPQPGFAIADIMRSSFRNFVFEILKPDGTPIGSIMTQGLNGGMPPPGAPLAQTGGSYAIIGGTGAFLGARGQGGPASGTTSNGRTNGRAASIAEDPANRRINGGGKIPFIFHLIPMYTPEIVSTPLGPAVTHSKDATIVTASSPAAPGELLSVLVTGLGPTIPGVDPGQAFPVTPPSVVNSDVVVTVNGQPVEVVSAVGLPGAADRYQVDFKIPAGIASGSASVRVSAAWAAGQAVTIDVQ